MLIKTGSISGQVFIDNVTLIRLSDLVESCPRAYKTFMLNSTEHEISTEHKNKMLKMFKTFKLSEAVFIMLINVKMPTIVGILIFMSMING